MIRICIYLFMIGQCVFDNIRPLVANCILSSHQNFTRLNKNNPSLDESLLSTPVNATSGRELNVNKPILIPTPVDRPLQVEDLIYIYTLRSKEEIEDYLHSKSKSWFYHALASDRSNAYVWINNDLRTSLGIHWSWSELRYEENERIYTIFLQNFEDLGFSKIKTLQTENEQYFKSDKHQIKYSISKSEDSDKSIIILTEHK